MDAAVGRDYDVPTQLNFGVRLLNVGVRDKQAHSESHGYALSRFLLAACLVFLPYH